MTEARPEMAGLSRTTSKTAKRTYVLGRRASAPQNQRITRAREQRAILTMINKERLEPDDFHVAVRRREHSETPWRGKYGLPAEPSR